MSKKLWPSPRTHEPNGQARRPGTWDTHDDEILCGESDFVVELMSPEDSILAAIDERRTRAENAREREQHFVCITLNGATPARRISGMREPTDSPVVRAAYNFDARRTEVVRLGKSCEVMYNRHRLADAPAADADEDGSAEGRDRDARPKQAPQPALPSGLRLKSFADLGAIMAAA